MTLVFFKKNCFDPKCRRTLAHSLKTIRDDWWAHAEMVIFPLLSTSLFVKSVRGKTEKPSLHIVQIWPHSNNFVPFLRNQAGKVANWRASKPMKPYNEFRGEDTSELTI